MGDKIRIQGIVLLNNGRSTFQIDLHNETKDEYYRLFVPEKELNEQLRKAKEISKKG